MYIYLAHIKTLLDVREIMNSVPVTRPPYTLLAAPDLSLDISCVDIRDSLE